MSVIGLVFNVLTLMLSAAIVVVFRYIDRDNRSLDKIKRYAASLQDEIGNLVNDSIQELKNTALDLEVNARAGHELLSDVSQENSRLEEIQTRIGGLENSVRTSESAMEQLATLTQSVEENMRNLRQESDFVTSVAKKVKEIDDRSQKIQTVLGEMLDDFESKAAASLERTAADVRADFEAEKKDYCRLLEDHKEAAERDWSSYVESEKEDLTHTLDEIHSLIDSLDEKGKEISSAAVSEMKAGSDSVLNAFRSQCEEQVRQEQETVHSVRDSLDRALKDLTAQVENVKFAHRESMEQIGKEKDQMEELFVQLRGRSAELSDKTAAQMGEHSRRAVQGFKDECETLRKGNQEQAAQMKYSFQETLASVAAQLDSLKETHAAALEQLGNEKKQMLALVAQHREKLEEKVKKELALVLSGVKEKTDTYTGIFDTKVTDTKSRIEKELSVLQEKQKRDLAAFLSQMDNAGASLDRRLEKFKTQAEDIETRYQRNIQMAAERSLKLEDDIFENLRRDIESRAGKSEKELESYLTSLFGKIEATNSEILHHFGEMRSDVEMRKEDSKKELEHLKSSIAGALHEADVSNREKITKMLTETENTRQRVKDDLAQFISRLSSDMKSFEARIADGLTRSENRLVENTEKIDRISAEIDTSGSQLIKDAEQKFKQTLSTLSDDLEMKIEGLNHLFEEHKLHFDYKVSQIDTIEADLERYRNEATASMERLKEASDADIERFAAEAADRREEERQKTEEGYRQIHATIESIGKEIEAVKTAAYESTSKQMSVYEDQFFADLRERTDQLNLKVIEWQQQQEKEMEQMLVNSRQHQAEAEQERRSSIADGLKKIEEQTDQEFVHLNNRIQALQEKISSDALRNEKEIEDFKNLIHKNIEGIQNEAQSTFEVEFSKYDLSVTAKLNEHQKNLDDTVETVKNHLEENISDLTKRFETSHSDLKVMHSNVIQQMKNTEADLRAKYADLKTSVSENVNMIKDSFTAQKEGVVEKSKREIDDLVKAVLIVRQDIEKLTGDLQQKSDNALIELNKKYDELYAEFTYKTDTLLNELDYKTRDFRQSSADTREKIEAVQQKLHNDVEEGRKNLSFRLDEITKRIRDFESQTKLFERADSLKKKLTEDIASLRTEIDQLVIKKKEFKDIDLTLSKVKAMETDIIGKLGQLQANKRIVDDLDKDFKRLQDVSAMINSRIDKVTSSNDEVMAMQARLRQLDDLEKHVEDQYSRLEKKEHVLNHTATSIDKNFEDMQDLETRIKHIEGDFNDMIGKLATASKRIEVLSNNKERADFAVDKLMGLDSLLADVDEKIESTNKSRQWLADIETRLVQLNQSAVKHTATLKEVVELSGGDGKRKMDQTDLVLNLAQQGWNAGDIAKKLNIGVGEVQLIIEMGLKKNEFK